MTAQAYRQLILTALLDLPDEALAEIAEFVFFVRRRSAGPRDSLKADLDALSQAETSHLEQEFLSYEQLYPVE